MTSKVTQAARGVFSFIQQYAADYGRAPTIADIYVNLGRLADKKIERALLSLQRKGHIRLPAERAERIEMLGPWRDPHISVSGRFHLFEAVVSTRDMDASSDVGVKKLIRRGTKGVVIELLSPDELAVEFFDENDKTIDVASLPESYVRPETAAEAEARHARTAKVA